MRSEGNDDDLAWRSALPFHPGDDESALAPHWPTPLASVREGCALARVSSEDVVYDLGCGEGACICEIASVTDATCVGVEIDHELATTARNNVKANRLDERVTILEEDARSIDLSLATCTWVFLVPTGLSELSTMLQEHLDRGGRVISYTFPLPVRQKYLQATGKHGNLFVYSKAPIA